MRSGHSCQRLPVDFCRAVTPCPNVKLLLLLGSVAPHMVLRAPLALLSKGLAQMQSSDPLSPVAPHAELNLTSLAFREEKKLRYSRKSWQRENFSSRPEQSRETPTLANPQE